MVPPNGVSRAARWVAVDELMVVGGVGEKVDHGLRDLAPGREPDLLADQFLEVFQRDLFHHKPLSFARFVLTLLYAHGHI